MQRLKNLRMEQNLSQQELAKRAGLGQSTIHYIETGYKSPTLKVLRKLAAALGVTVSELIGEETNTTRAS
ncbi:MAG: helix-turn-helix transcriptional regulator [Bacillota bacterium]|nr:helix-turn-helix transcriptional regulator [Bacillota bacterium]